MIRIETTQIGEDGFSVSGEEPGELLDLAQDPVALEAGPIRYDLTVERAGQELVVRGQVEAPLRLRCSRCANIFSTIARVSSFLHAYEWAEHPESLDVSADVREDVLLEIPGFPLCHDGLQRAVCPMRPGFERRPLRLRPPRRGSVAVVCVGRIEGTPRPPAAERRPGPKEKVKIQE